MDFSAIINAPKTDAILAERNINGFEAPGGTDKQTFHSYGPVYEALMEPLASKQSVILEVGVQLGGSLLLWHDLCPSSHVIGVDCQNLVHPSIFERMEGSRYSFVQNDAYTADAIHAVQAVAPDGLDFAIDDGPHSLESQCAFLQMYTTLLKPGGIAVVEDIQAESWFEVLIGHVPEGMTYEMVDRRQIKGRYDDLMLIVQK
jgi:cephalosporin hydroxylase